MIKHAETPVKNIPTFPLTKDWKQKRIGDPTKSKTSLEAKVNGNSTFHILLEKIKPFIKTVQKLR